MIDNAASNLKKFCDIDRSGAAWGGGLAGNRVFFKSNEGQMANPLRSVKGAVMTEYLLIVGFIAAVAVIALTSVGSSLASFFFSARDMLANLQF